MRRLTPAGVSTMMVVVVALLVTAYFAKLMRAEERRPVATTQPMPGATTQPRPVEVRSVPTAATTLEPGTVITAAQLGMSRARSDALGPDVLQDKSVIGRVVKERIAAGSLIRSAQLYATGERPQLTASRGMRGVSIALRRAVSPITGLTEGQYVDVYLTPRADAANDGRLQGAVTLTLFRGVRLLAVTPSPPGTEAVDVAMLELTPDQAAALILARQRGDIALSSNPEGKGDGGIALKPRDRAAFDELLGRPADPAASAGRPTTFTSEVFKGSARSTRQFEERTKTEAAPTSTPANSSTFGPQWTRRSRAQPQPAQPRQPVAPALRSPLDRVSMLPDQTTFR